MEYWDRLTKDTRRALLVAQEEAAGVGASDIAAAHLLVGLVLLGEGSAVDALRRLGLEPSRLIGPIRRAIPRGEAPTLGPLGYSEDAEAAFRLAAEEADRVGSAQISSAHLLLGLTHEHSGAAKMLASVGVTAEALRALLPEPAEPAPAEPEAAEQARQQDIDAAIMELVRARGALEQAKVRLRALGVSLTEQAEQSARAAEREPASRPKVVVAPDAFKGSLSASEACAAIAEGVHRAIPEAEVTKIPLADGGEGTVQAMVDATGGYTMEVEVAGPLRDPVVAAYGVLGDGETAVIEMAAASGLPLVPEQRRNPLLATTYGTGQLIGHALEHGCKRLIIGLGGSATVDGGAGMAQALGVQLVSLEGDPIGFGGGELARLGRMDVGELRERVTGVTVLGACDVNNPLCGPTGAAMVYGPQKGASAQMAALLDGALANFGRVVKQDLGLDVVNLPGAGAAGGLGAGLVAFLGAELRPGIEIVLDAVGFEAVAQDADVIITGEGRLDMQTTFGKTISGVTSVAKRHGVPVIAFAGSIDSSALSLGCEGVDAMLPILNEPMSLEHAMEPDNARRMLAQASEQAMRAGALLR